jgi:hypothetical protein
MPLSPIRGAPLAGRFVNTTGQGQQSQLLALKILFSRFLTPARPEVYRVHFGSSSFDIAVGLAGSAVETCG